jgi:hypothetical protein
MKKYNPEDGVPLDTTFLAVATVMHGEVMLLGSLQDTSKKDELVAAMRDQVSPGRPMHLVEVKIVARVIQTEVDNKS